MHQLSQPATHQPLVPKDSRLTQAEKIHDKIFKIFSGPASNTDVSYGKLNLYFDPDVIQIKLCILVQIIDLFLTVSM